MWRTFPNVFIAILFINSNESSESLLYLIRSKRIPRVKKGWAIAWIACLIINRITVVYSYGFLFNRTIVGQVSDLMFAFGWAHRADCL